MKRRTFFGTLLTFTLSVTGILILASYLRQFVPGKRSRSTRRLLGSGKSYPLDTYTYRSDCGVFVYRDNEGVRALSAVCTHLGCVLTATPDGFECPCHGSAFNREGQVLYGPAPRSLHWYAVERQADGNLVVDTARTVGPDVKCPGA
ncbi:MAG: Rieske 2Fe-2S domain-containing protein [Bacteroidales bacterium]